MREASHSSPGDLLRDSLAAWALSLHVAGPLLQDTSSLGVLWLRAQVPPLRVGCSGKPALKGCSITWALSSRH